MKNIMFCMATVILLFSMSGAYASDIEEVIVVGAKVSVATVTQKVSQMLWKQLTQQEYSKQEA